MCYGSTVNSRREEDDLYTGTPIPIPTQKADPANTYTYTYV